MEQERQNTDSVYDFLYIDRERVSSWLAQLDADGILSSILQDTKTDDAASNEASTAVKTAGEMSALLVAKGSLEHTYSQKRDRFLGTTLSNQRVYDASWSLPVNLLDLLDANGLLHRFLSLSTPSSIVLCSGTAQIVDISFLQRVWAPASKFFTSQAKKEKRAKSVVAGMGHSASIVGEILNVMPPNPQMNLQQRSGERVWGVLKPDAIVVNAATLGMMHGDQLSGEWHVLGILDALPDDQTSPEEPIEGLGPLMGPVALIVGQLRELMGRPPSAYGITPALIFRKISTPVQAMDS